MASSGTYDYSLSNGEAVLAAFARCTIHPPAILQNHMLTARRETNLLFSEWSNRQVNLWRVESFSTNLTEGDPSYDVDPRVVMILDAYISLNNGESNQTDRYVTPFSRTDYASQSNKQTQGFPTNYWFDRLISPTATFWPVPDSGGPYTFNYYAATQIQDAALTGGQTPDIPYRWLDALVAGLAKRLARCFPPQGVDPTAFKAGLDADYNEAWTHAATQDVENVNLRLSPQIGGYYRR